MSSGQAIINMVKKVCRYAWMLLTFVFVLLYAIVRVCFDPKAFEGAEKADADKASADSLNVSATSHSAIPTAVASSSQSQLPVIASQLAMTPAITPASSLREVFHGEMGDPSTVSMQMRFYAGASPRIERTLKVPSIRKDWQRSTLAFERVTLSTFTPAIAEKAGLAFSFDGAHKFSKTELQNGRKAAPEQPVIQQRASLAAQAPAPTLLLGGNTGDAQNQVSEAEGVLTSAGSATITPKSGRPYTTFTVVLATANGEVSFSGEELKKKFNNREFGLQDLLAVKQTKEQFEVKGADGPQQRSRNVYTVSVLKKAQF